MDLAEYVFQPLRKSEKFILHQVAKHAEAASGLMSVSDSQRPAFETLKKIEYDYSLRTELYPNWAAEPLALSLYKQQTAVVLHDPGGETLDSLYSRIHGTDRIFALCRRSNNCTQTVA